MTERWAMDSAFRELDLNLLVTLDRLLAEKSVALVAEGLRRPRSSISGELRRLREYFADDLLVASGARVVLTARAQELVQPIRVVLDKIRTTIEVTPEFDAATAEGSIRIMASDYSTQVLLTHALGRLSHEAPLMSFEIQPMASMPTRLLEQGHIDLLLTTACSISIDHPSLILFEDDYVVVGSRENPAMDDPITLQSYLECGHVTAPASNASVATYDEWFRRRQRRQRRIEVVAPTVFSIGGLLVNTRRVATIRRRLAEQLVRTMPLAMHDLPFEAPSIREAVQWHLSRSNNAGLRWVVEHLQSCASEA